MTQEGMHIKSPPSCWTLMRSSFCDVYCVCVFIHSVLTPSNLMDVARQALLSMESNGRGRG